ncbi:MAG: hypothetical protein GF350_17545 [Chitinivibrionales bacterium]|nr:hypothetical protein [Chitinivibrionales bacterium]
MKKTIIAVLPVLFFWPGCYTQFATLDRVAAEESFAPDSTAEELAKNNDTVVVRDREYCYWTRDFWGYPELRCYESYYSMDWFRYNRSPWWRRYDPYWFDYDRCPRYYYYDHTCGCCRYYYNDPYQYGQSNRSESSGGSRTRRSRSYGVPSGSAASPSPGPSVSGEVQSKSSSEKSGSGSEGPDREKRRAPRGKRVPGTLMRNSGTHNTPSTSTRSETPVSSREDEIRAQPASSTPPASDPQRHEQADTSGTGSRRKTRRRNPRSW